MKIYILLPLFVFTGCATVERDPNAAWVREWNGLDYCHANASETHNCSYEECARHLEAGDWERRRRIIPGLVDKSAETTPIVDPAEREIAYLVILNPYLVKLENHKEFQRIKAEIETALKANPTEAESKKLQARSEWNSKNLENSTAELPKVTEKANRFMRRLMELPQRNFVSHLMLSRLGELLSGANYPVDIPIAPGARHWRFQFTQSPSDYVLHDFRERYRDAAEAKRHGVVSEYVRAAFPFLWGGLRFDNELVINQMNGYATFAVVDAKGRDGLLRFARLKVKDGNPVARYPVTALTDKEAEEKIHAQFPHGVEIVKMWRDTDEVVAEKSSEKAVPESPAKICYTHPLMHSVQGATAYRCPASMDENGSREK